MNVYVEMIEDKKDALGRQVFFLGFDDPYLEGGKRFQVFNAILGDYIEKFTKKGYNIIYL